MGLILPYFPRKARSSQVPDGGSGAPTGGGLSAGVWAPVKLMATSRSITWRQLELIACMLLSDVPICMYDAWRASIVCCSPSYVWFMQNTDMPPTRTTHLGARGSNKQ